MLIIINHHHMNTLNNDNDDAMDHLTIPSRKLPTYFATPDSAFGRRCWTHVASM